MQQGDLFEGALQDAETEVERDEFLPAEFALDDEAEAPEEHHVPDQMQHAGMQEKTGQPLQRMDTPTVRECVVARIGPPAGSDGAQ